MTVSGADNTLLVSGDCAQVDISGDRNVIRVTSVAAILVNGDDNQVTYFSGKPDINNTGFSNIVEPA